MSKSCGECLTNFNNTTDDMIPLIYVVNNDISTSYCNILTLYDIGLLQYFLLKGRKVYHWHTGLWLMI